MNRFKGKLREIRGSLMSGKSNTRVKNTSSSVEGISEVVGVLEKV